MNAMNQYMLNPSAFGGRKVIDTDTHLTEPHDLWTKRAPARLKDRVPQVKVHNGVRSWIVDGDKILLQGAIPSSTVQRDGSRWPTRLLSLCAMALPAASTTAAYVSWGE